MRYRFGAHALDLARRELHRDGAPVVVEPKVFDLLAYLLENRDRVVGKGELVEQVWGGRIVSDAAIDTAVKAARQAVGDSGAAQDTIRTIPRKGVRFVAAAGAEMDAPFVPANPTLPALPDKPSIAVLPFNNMSSDPEQEYFADGLTEDITTGLARLHWLFVIARNSAFTYKGKAVDVRAAGAELGVRYLLEGGIRTAGGTIRVTAQLIDAETAAHIWAGRYDRPIGDIFAVQDEITESVVAAIEPHLYAREGYRAQNQPPESMDAWACVSRAVPLMLKLTRQNNLEARKFLEQAVAIAPGYARAHAVLAWAEWWSGLCFWTNDLAGTYAKAMARAEQAVVLDPAEPWARLAFGMSLSTAGEHDRALAQLETALQLNPSFALGHTFHGQALARAGRFEQGVEASAKALRMSPVDDFSGVYHVFHGLALLGARRFEEALAASRKSVSAHPDFPGHYHVMISCCGYLGLLEEAKPLIAARNRIGPPLRWSSFLHNQELNRQAAMSAEGLRLAGVPE